MCDAAFSSKSVLQNVMPAAADAGRLVDERDLAEASTRPRRARPPRGPRRRPSLRSPRVIRPFEKVISRSRTTVPPTEDERLRRAHRALRAPAVGRREHLLGRQVRARRSGPSAVSLPAAIHRDCGSRPIVRSVPGPRKRTASKPRSFIWRRARLQHARCAPSRLRRDRARRAAPSPGSRPRAAPMSGSPNTCSAQAGVGKATIVHGISPWSNASQYARRTSGMGGLRDPLRVEAGEQVRIRLADDVHEGGAALALLLDPLERPARRPADGLVGRERGLRAADVDVEVVDVRRGGRPPRRRRARSRGRAAHARRRRRP